MLYIYSFCPDNVLSNEHFAFSRPWSWVNRTLLPYRSIFMIHLTLMSMYGSQVTDVNWFSFDFSSASNDLLLTILLTAETFLESVEVNENYPMLLLKLLTRDNVEMTIRIACAITFKNYIKRNWHTVCLLCSTLIYLITLYVSWKSSSFKFYICLLLCRMRTQKTEYQLMTDWPLKKILST